MDSPAPLRLNSQTTTSTLPSPSTLAETPLTPPVKERRPLALQKMEHLNVSSHQELKDQLTWTKSLGSLTWLTRNKSDHYSVIRLKKTNGKTRTIHNPDSQMRRAQWRICSNILNQVPIPEYIWGFERGKSVPKMAEVHKGKNVVISLDIKDFFPSIKQVDVKRIFESLGVKHEPSATILSELCTYKAFVPQGALTSPKLSNIMVAATFGPLIKQFCDAYKLNLSIYADDVTVSFDAVPEIVDGKTDMTQRDFVKKIINFVRTTLEEFHFRLNPDKIKVMRRHNRQWVCGAVVNDRVNMMKRDRANLRALVHNCELHGIEREAGKTGLKTLGFIQKFGGKLNWYRQLNAEKGGPLYARFKKMSLPLTKQYPGFDLDKISYDSGAENPETFAEMQAGSK